MSGFWRKKDRWEGIDYLNLVPQHRVAARENEPDGRIRVLMPRYSDPVFSRLLQPWLPEDKKYLTVTLDPRGSFLWRQVDGLRSIADLTEAFVGEFPGEKEAAPQRVSLYLHAMYENRFISYLNLPS